VFQIKTALIYWCDAVDIRLNALPPDEEEVILHNPSMNHEQTFGTEA
jgi:hypothetical protein